MKQWFVASTKAREERRALFNLKQQGVKAYFHNTKKLDDMLAKRT